MLLAVLVAGALVIRAGDDGDPPLPRGPVEVLPRSSDPFVYTEARREEFEGRAATGLSHVLYDKSPGGAVESARRTARWRPVVERVAERSGLDPDMLEAIVLLESAGRPDAVADPELEGAVGLTQILASTGQGLLGMRVDTAASRALTARIARARRRERVGRVRRLEAARRRVDHRFDPRRALAATARYLNFSRRELGRDDLAVVAYHMGVGNLGAVLRDFGEGGGVSYARLFFDSSPTRHAAAHRRLARLGDDSSTYYWRVLAARRIMRALRRDPEGLSREARLQTARASSEQALHPPGETRVYGGPDDLEEAYRRGELRPFPDAPGRTGLRRDPAMGQLARRLDRGRRLYRGLRPEAYALALYMAGLARRAGGGPAPLTLTSTVRDREYQGLLVKGNPEAVSGYSLHTTGWSFDVLRRYSGGRQARAFQFALDRLEALGLIAWALEPGAVHVTVSEDAAALVPLLEETRR